MAVVKSSSTVVVFFSELMRRMSSANLRKERFVSGSCSAKLTPWLPLFHIFCSWFHVFFFGSALNRSVLGGSPCLVPCFMWKCLFVTSVCTVARCWLWSFESKCMYGSWMPCSLEALHTLLCSKTFEEKLAEESV